jgi:hypothetical protein
MSRHPPDRRCVRLAHQQRARSPKKHDGGDDGLVEERMVEQEWRQASIYEGVLVLGAASPPGVRRPVA